MVKQDNIPPHIQQIVDNYNLEIEEAKARIASYVNGIGHLKMLIKSKETARDAYLKYQPAQVPSVLLNQPLTRELVRNVMTAFPKALQTVQFVDMVYPDIAEKERTKLIRTLSVIFNQMAEDKEITIDKVKGVKGNFYTYNQK